MPRSRSHSTSSLPGNLMASWSIQSYPASRVEDAVEDLPPETHYSTTLQLIHERPTEEMAPPTVSPSSQSIQPPVLVDATITEDVWLPSFASLQHSLTLPTIPPPAFMEHLPPAQFPPPDFISEINHSFEHSRHTRISSSTSVRGSGCITGAHPVHEHYPPINLKPALPAVEDLHSKTPYPDIDDQVTYEYQAKKRILLSPPVFGAGSDLVDSMSGATYPSAEYPSQIHAPTYPPPPGAHPLTDWQGYAYQHTSLPTYTHSTTYPSTHTQRPAYSSNYTYSLPTYAHPTTYPSTCTPWHSNSLDSTYLSANPYPVNTTCRQDTHHPFFSASQYLDRGLLPPPSPKLSDAKAPAQVWEGQYNYGIKARYMQALSLMFEYWTSQDVSRRCVIITLTSLRAITQPICSGFSYPLQLLMPYDLGTFQMGVFQMKSTT